jgi:hypothetical protein
LEAPGKGAEVVDVKFDLGFDGHGYKRV